DFQSTLHSSLTNMLNEKYFGEVGQGLIAASPMLALCYFSPSMCSVLRGAQANASVLSQMRLSQCALTEKYIDKRVDDFYAERQSCVQKHIEENGGDLETAMDACRNIWDVDLPDWAGGGGKAESNKLIESSATWAGYEGEAADR